jgi:RNA polymerase sigma factor (sigma-70 family)
MAPEMVLQEHFERRSFMNGILSELELMKLIASRNEEAFKKLYDRYERPVYAFACRMGRDTTMAEEIVRELFLRIWNKTERYDGAQGKRTSWMFTLTRNIAVDLLRKKRRRTPQYMAEPEQLNFVADERTVTEAEVEIQWVGGQIRAALQDLNKDQKQIMELIYYQGYTHQEVSDRHDIPLATVKSRVRSALKQLQLRLSVIGRREFGNE